MWLRLGLKSCVVKASRVKLLAGTYSKRLESGRRKFTYLHED